MGTLILIFVYFLPSIVALIRNHNNTMAISVGNLILGWTILGWLIALIWACTNNTKK